jgi:hypothetical protein
MLWSILAILAGLPLGGNILVAVLFLPLFILLDVLSWMRRNGCFQFLLGIFATYLAYAFIHEWRFPLPPVPTKFGEDHTIAYRAIRVLIGTPALEVSLQVCHLTAGILRGVALLCNALASAVDLFAKL